LQKAIKCNLVQVSADEKFAVFFLAVLNGGSVELTTLGKYYWNIFCNKDMGE